MVVAVRERPDDLLQGRPDATAALPAVTRGAGAVDGPSLEVVGVVRTAATARSEQRRGGDPRQEPADQPTDSGCFG